MRLIGAVGAVGVPVAPQGLGHARAAEAAVLVKRAGHHAWERIVEFSRGSLKFLPCHLFFSFSPTALLFIGPVGAVSLAVTQEGVRHTASVVVTAAKAALCLTGTVHFIRSVLAVVPPVTHLLRWDAFTPVSTTELI